MQIIQIEFGTPDFDEAVRLRYEILRQPLGLEYTTEQLAAEYDNIHLAAYSDSGRIIGYLNLTPHDTLQIKMRQVAVAAASQGMGVGKALVVMSELVAKQLGYSEIVLHARETAVPFYLKLGYRKIGEPFEEVTIPHFKMGKNIAPAQTNKID